MIKRLLTCLLLIISVQAIAQQKSTIVVTKSERGTRVSPDVYKVYKGTFVQKYSVLTCDSALIYYSTNTIDAFGHVVITQGDTLHVYADKLNYNDNTKVAILTDNVKMVDRDATLTTNWLNYNTATKVGTYVDGGKIVNKENTLTSRNGYYYSNTRDVYFRYEVVTNGPDAMIYTDTMRYNSGSKITYFYGPTRILGKKDKDTLYTENGTYNTKTEQAFFGKKNRYSQGTKSLKGDSLFYDKLKGYGKAIRNVTFEDTEQRMVLKGHLGEYFRKEEKAVVTQNPYVIIISEEKDTTQKAATINPLPGKKTTDGLSNAVNAAQGLLPGGTLPDTKGLIPGNLTGKKADSLAKALAANPAVKGAMPLANSKLADSLKKVATGMAMSGKMPTLSSKQQDSLKKIATQIAMSGKVTGLTTKQQDSVSKLAGKMGVALPNVQIPGVKTNPAQNKPAVTNKAVTPARPITKPTVTKAPPRIPDPIYTGPDLHLNEPKAKPDTGRRLKRDTMYIGADTLETQIITYKALKDMQEKRRLAGIIDTNRKIVAPFVPYTLKTLPKVLEQPLPKFPYAQYPVFKERPLPYLPKKDTTAKLAPVAKKPVVAAAKPVDKAKAAATDSLKAKHKADSILAAKPLLPDTARVRILSAHHNVRIFRSDLQGKSDSLFYSAADSIIRSYIRPMYWSQGAQLSGDTIYLQMKNKKPDYMDVFPKGFLVYIEKKDSTHFNQMGGKRIQAWFRNNKIHQVLVTGNAETIYFKRNEKTDVVTDMQRSISSKITINFKDGKTSSLAFTTKLDQNATPLKDLKEEDKTLKNFIWKPKERPASKEDVINPKKPIVPKPETTKKGTAPANKPGAKPSADKKADGKDEPKADPGKPLATPSAGKDSVKTAPKKLTPIKTKQDSSAKAKPDPVKKAPELKAVKDTSAKKVQ